MRGFKQQQGVALITALLVMAICAAFATFLLVAQRLLLNQAVLVKGNDAMLLAMEGVQDWAIDSLSKTQNLHKVHDMAKDLYGVKVTGMISALGGRFNLNSLQQTKNIPHFVSLLKLVAPDFPEAKAKAVALALSSWQQPKDPNNNYYLDLPMPYRAANQPLADISELRLVKGVTAELYQQLAGGKQTYITALPSTEDKVDVNWATVPVLASIGMSQGQAEALVQCRGNQFFVRQDDFTHSCGTNLQAFANLLTVNSDYYMVTAKAKRGDQRRVMHTLLKLQVINRHPKITVVWQEIDSD